MNHTASRRNNVINFAGDIVLLAESKEELEVTINNLNVVLEKKYKMRICRGKDEVMELSTGNDGIRKATKGYF